MLSLEEAREIQQNKEKKSLKHFSISMILCVIFFVIIFSFTDLLVLSRMFLILPVLTMLFAMYYSGILEFFSPKTFSGKIVKIKFYSIRDNKVRGAGWYMPSMLESKNAIDVTLVDINGRKLRRTFHDGDIISRLKENVEITVLRFVDKPIINE